jgi:hypothetical protein
MTSIGRIDPLSKTANLKVPGSGYLNPSGKADRMARKVI